MNTFHEWVIAQGIQSPPGFRAERFMTSPWFQTKAEAISWIQEYERREQTGAAAVSIIHPSDYPGDAS